jgi:hypothetical protein
VSGFGLENGPAMLEAVFEEVELRRFPDRLLVAEPNDVLAYAVSYPPGEDAIPEQVKHLEAEISAAFVRGDGALEVVKDVGLFLCQGPRFG